MARISTLAVHIGGDIATAGPGWSWPRPFATRDTVRRTWRMCRRAGIVEQRRLIGLQATKQAVLAALQHASEALAEGGRFVLVFSGHTRRGEGPPETAQWCLVDGGLALGEVASALARLPVTAELILINDTCYAAAIAEVLCGPQRAIVLASCGAEQTAIMRERSMFAVRLERFMRASSSTGSLDELRRALEVETPDCERPVVWANHDSGGSTHALEAIVRRSRPIEPGHRVAKLVPGDAADQGASVMVSSASSPAVTVAVPRPM